MEVKYLVGQKFGRLTVIDRAPNNKYGRAMWNCVCDCGNKTVVSGNDLLQGHTKSCGCYQLEAAIKSATTHGMSKTRLHYIWRGIKDRCLNKNSTAFKSYGERGITICDEWKNSFESFAKWSLSHGYEENLSIDRINNDLGYSPENCRWADAYTQANNKRRTLMFTYNGERKALKEWCKIYEKNYNTVHNRIYAGVPFEIAMFADNLHKKNFTCETPKLNLQADSPDL